MNILTRIKDMIRTPAPVPAPDPAPVRVIRQFTLPSSMQARGILDAAGTGRLLSDWTVTNTTADRELRGTLDSLRARSRQMFFNDPYLRKFIKLLENNVVGPEGVLLGAKAKLPDGSLDAYDNRIIEREWYEWVKKGNCDISKTYSFVELQKQIMRAVSVDGEVFLKKITGRQAGNRWGFAVKVIEADWLATRHSADLPNGNRVRLGVETDSNDRIVAYYFYTTNPADDPTSTMVQAEMTRVPAETVIHIYYRDRISQHRGAPWAICTMMNLRHINKYIESEVVAARVAAAQMGFLKTPTGTEYTGETNQDYFTEMEVEPGVFKQLPQGWELQPFNPQHPSTQFQQFIKSMIRGVAVGLGIGYSNLSSDRESVNYSSLRQEALEEQDNWKTMQGWFIDTALNPIYDEWLNCAMAEVLPFPAGKTYKYKDIVWYPRRWSWVDPQKDIQALILALQNKLTSRTKILSDQGLDFEQTIQELAIEKQLMSKYGITDNEINNAMTGGNNEQEQTEQTASVQ